MYNSQTVQIGLGSSAPSASFWGFARLASEWVELAKNRAQTRLERAL